MNLYLIGDLHCGSKNFNEKLFNHFLDTFRRDKAKKKILLNGDLVDALDSNRFYKDKETWNLNESIEYVVDNLKPFKKYILAGTTSNHGQRLKKQFDFDIDKNINDQLGVPTYVSFHEDVPIGKNRSIRVFAQHHAPVSKSALLAMRRFINEMETIDSDLYIGGHNHLAMGISKIYRGLDYTPYRKHYCFSGSFLNYQGSYAEGHYGFIMPGYTVICINKKSGKVNFNITYSDEIEGCE